MVEHVRVGQTPGPVTLGGRWAFVPNMGDGTVTQIERASGKVLATIKVSDPQVLRDQGCAPTSVHAYYSGSWGWRSCNTPYAVAWDGLSLWALDNGQNQLLRIDPISHRVREKVSLPGNGWDVAVSGSTAWVSGNDADHSVYEVDLRTLRVVATINNLDQGTASLAVGPDGVWVLCSRAATGHLDRIDPATASVVNRSAVEWWSTAVIDYRGAVYVRGTYGGDISRVNVETGVTEWTRPGPGFIGPNGIDQIAAVPTGVWLAGPTTARVDPGTGAIAETIHVASISAAADSNEVWLVLLDGSVAEFKRR
jgi:DNA-binding beta-propeller fold protein YncE